MNTNPQLPARILTRDDLAKIVNRIIDEERNPTDDLFTPEQIAGILVELGHNQEEARHAVTAYLEVEETRDPTYTGTVRSICELYERRNQLDNIAGISRNANGSINLDWADIPLLNRIPALRKINETRDALAPRIDAITYLISQLDTKPEANGLALVGDPRFAQIMRRDEFFSNRFDDTIPYRSDSVVEAWNNPKRTDILSTLRTLPAISSFAHRLKPGDAIQIQYSENNNNVGNKTLLAAHGFFGGIDHGAIMLFADPYLTTPIYTVAIENNAIFNVRPIVPKLRR